MAKKEESESQEDRHVIHLIYIGVRKSRQGKKSCLWHEVELEENTGERLRFDQSKRHVYDGKGAKLGCTNALPGAIISIEAHVSKPTVYPGTSQLVSYWENEDDVVQWRAESKVHQSDIEISQQAAKKARRGLEAEVLEPFREAFWGCNRRQQANLLAWILQQVMSPDKLG
jgi:hypothetical protein